jgi:hypothetical protein
MAAAFLDPGAREGLVKRGQERVREFSWDRAAVRLLSLFSDVLGPRERVEVHRRTARPFGAPSPSL